MSNKIYELTAVFQPSFNLLTDLLLLFIYLYKCMNMRLLNVSYCDWNKAGDTECLGENEASGQASQRYVSLNVCFRHLLTLYEIVHLQLHLQI